MVFRIALVVLVAAAAAQAQLNGKLKISVVTTSGCGDTVNFITNQLNGVYEEYGNLLELEFIPWGRTVRNQDGSLTCQFQERDCWANRLQRCVLDKLKDNQKAQMFYMNCEFSSPYPSFLQQSYLCAQSVGLNTVDLDTCVSTPAGDPLDAAAEALAAAPMQAINFVPAIVFNDQIDLSLQTQALTNLRRLVCSILSSDESTGVTNCAV